MMTTDTKTENEKFTCSECREEHRVADKKLWGSWAPVCPTCEDHLFDEFEEREKRRFG